MRCEEYKRWLSAYVDGLLDQAQRTELDSHLADCAGCSGELVSLKKLLVSLRSLGEVEAPKDLLAGVRAKLSREPGWKRLLAWRPVIIPRHGVAVALTAVLVLFVASIPIYLKRTTPYALRSNADSLGQQFGHRNLVARRQSAVRDRLETQRASTPERETRKPLALADAPQVAAQRSVSLGVPAQHQRVDEDSGESPTPSAPLMGAVGDAAASRGFAVTNQSVSAGNQVVTVPKGLEQAGAPLAAEGGYRQTLPVAASPTPTPPPQTEFSQDLKTVASEPVQLQWTVTNRAEATANLSEWLAKIEGATMSISEDRLVVRLPSSHYPNLFEELAKHGMPSDASGRFADAYDESLSPQKEADKHEGRLLAYKIAAPEAQPTELFVTVELTLLAGSPPAAPASTSSSTVSGE